MRRKDILVYHRTTEEFGYDEALDILSYLGYPIRLFTSSIPDEDCYVIDHRYPTWRGWKEAIRDIVVFHPNDMVSYRKHKIDNKSCTLYYDDTECAA